MNAITTREVTNQLQWDNFVQSRPLYTFLQSWAWGEFHIKEGEKIRRLGFFTGQKLLGVALVVIVVARRGKFLFCPHGPIIDWGNKLLVAAFFVSVRGLAQKENCWFVRISAIADGDVAADVIGILQKNGYLASPMHMHAQSSWMLDISPSEETLLGGMRKTTRYLVRQGEKLGLAVEILSGRGGMETFTRLHQHHAKSHNYVPFSKNYLLHEWKAFSPDNIAVFLTKYKKQTLAAAIIIFYGQWAFYYQAVTKKSKLPAGYLLVWGAIKQAKERCCVGFNFWGIAPDNKPHHPWAGLTLFKQGFGGRRVDFPPAYDLPLSPFYWLTYCFETARRLKRGF